MRKNKIRVVTPSAVIGTMRVGSTGESDEPAEPRERPSPPRDGAAPIPATTVAAHAAAIGPAAAGSAAADPAVIGPGLGPGSTPTPPPEPRFDDVQTLPPSEPLIPPQDNSTALPAAAHFFFAVQTTETPSNAAEPQAESPTSPTPGTAPAPVAPPSTDATSEPPSQPKASADLPASPPAKDPGEAEASESEPAPIIVAPGPGGIMIASSDTAALDEFERLLTSLAGDSLAGGPEVTIFYLKHTKAEIVAETLDQIFGGGTIAASGGGGGVRWWAIWPARPSAAPPAASLVLCSAAVAAAARSRRAAP